MNILEENEWFVFWEEEGIICCQYKKPDVDLEIAKKTVETRLKVSNNRPSRLFVDLKNIKSASQEARNYYQTEEAMYLADASAVLAHSLLAKIIATFFVTFHKPRKPFKIFTDKEKAFDWLKNLRIE